MTNALSLFILASYAPFPAWAPERAPNRHALMKLNRLTPNMMVEDVNRTIDFYRDVLGFELVMSVPEHGLYQWALMKREDVEVMFQARASLVGELPAWKDRPVGGALTLYIDLEGVEALYEEVRRNASVVKDLHDTFYGTQEFSIEDCNGYILTFAETRQN